MIISHKYKFIWLFPVGHTASTSIWISLKELHDDEKFLGLYSPEALKEFENNAATPAYIPNFAVKPAPDAIFLDKHASGDDLLNAGFDRTIFNDYTKISVCRNPYTWMAAQMRKNINQKKYTKESIGGYMGGNWFRAMSKINPQTHLLERVDKIIKFEQLEEEWYNLSSSSSAWEDLCSVHDYDQSDVQLGVTIPCGTKLKRLVKDYEYDQGTFSNASGKLDHMLGYEPDGIELINEVCHEDFINLGYNKL